MKSIGNKDATTLELVKKCMTKPMIRSKQENVEAPAHTREVPVGVNLGESHMIKHIAHLENVKTHFTAKRYFVPEGPLNKKSDMSFHVHA